MNQSPGCAVRRNMLRNSPPSSKPQTGPIRSATSSPRQLPHHLLLVLVAGREHHQVGRQRFAPSFSRDALGDEAVDVGKLQQPDLAVDDQVRAADIEVIAAAAPQILHLQPGLVLAVVQPEAARCEPVEQRPCRLRAPCAVESW